MAALCMMRCWLCAAATLGPGCTSGDGSTSRRDNEIPYLKFLPSCIPNRPSLASGRLHTHRAERYTFGMVILTHGSDMSLAPSVTALLPAAGGTLKQVIARLMPLGARQVQLDATRPGLRPRELSHRARKDLMAMLNRNSMSVAGLDLFIPRWHFRKAEHQDRAMSAAMAAMELAADLGRVPLSIALPVKDLNKEVREALVEGADGRGIRLAVHAEDQVNDLLAWMNEVDMPALGAAIDPGGLVAAGVDAAEVAHRLGKRLTVGRLSDANRSADPDEGDTVKSAASVATRCPVGRGELDVAAYRIALDIASHRAGPVVLDLRGLESPFEACVVATKAWQDAATRL